MDYQTLLKIGEEQISQAIETHRKSPNLNMDAEAMGAFHMWHNCALNFDEYKKSDCEYLFSLAQQRLTLFP